MSVQFNVDNVDIQEVESAHSVDQFLIEVIGNIAVVKVIPVHVIHDSDGVSQIEVERYFIHEIADFFAGEGVCIVKIAAVKREQKRNEEND